MIGLEQSNQEYHADKAIGSTTLKKYMENPVKAFKLWNGEIEMKKTEALIMGSLIHCLALEPHTFGDEFTIAGDGWKKPNEDMMQMIDGNIVDKPLRMYPTDCLTSSGKLSTAKKEKLLIAQFEDKNAGCLIVTPKESSDYALWKTNQDKEVITEEQYDFAKGIADKALAYEFQMTTTEGVFTFTLQDAINHESAIMERAFYAWYCPVSKEVTVEKKSGHSIRVKVKPDILLDVGNKAYVAIDLKSAIDASPTSFRKGGGLFYHLQEAHYVKVLEANGLKIYKFKFLFAGKEEWSTCQDYEYDIASKELGVDQFHKTMKQHELALKGDLRETTFDGKEYDREPVLGLPNYMFYLD